jgi:hypothetical protein
MIFAFMNSIPVAGWMVSFLSGAVDFLVDSKDWRISIADQIFQWIGDAIDTLIDGSKTTVDIVKEILKTEKKFFLINLISFKESFD